MSEQTYGTPTGGGTEGGTSPASDDNVSNPQGSQPEGQEQKGNEYVTKAEFMSKIDEVLRASQSMTDKMGSRLDKEIQSALDQAKQAIDLGKQAGMKYTPEQEQAIRDRAINTAYSRLNQDPQSQPQNSVQQPAQQPKQDMGNPATQLINQEINRIMRETGVFIPPEEANALILGEGENLRSMSPLQYVQAFEGLARQRQLNSQPSGPNPSIPSYVTGGKAPTSQTALRQQYEKEIAQIKNGTHPTIKRGGNSVMAIQNLEISYRKRGLDI
jgi:hypothetical protein